MHDAVGDLIRLARTLSAEWSQWLNREVRDVDGRPLMMQFQLLTGSGRGSTRFPDAIAQAIVCGTLSIRQLQTFFARQPSGEYPSVAVFSQLCGQVLETCRRAGGGTTGSGGHPLLNRSAEQLARQWPAELSAFSAGDDIDLFEDVLAGLDGKQRRGRGVYYTPRPVARYIVGAIDRVLRDELNLADGLADVTTWRELSARGASGTFHPPTDLDAPVVTILDPALGTGVFLREVILRIHATLSAQWTDNGFEPRERTAAWNEYVPRHLLPRICGLELMLPAAVVAHVNLTRTLAETGFTAWDQATLPIWLTNSLAGPPTTQGALFSEDDAIDDEPAGAADARAQRTYTVVLGNPPFAGRSANRLPWIDQLLRTGGGAENEAAGGDRRAASAQPGGGYYAVDGEPLGERKVWLQDDYVKFIRFAQWHIDRTGFGVVGLVTNHGFLDNHTFRGMRQQLGRSFARISVIDLHGNAKKKERSPAPRDMNVFDIEQGVAISLFRTSGRSLPSDSVAVHHRDTWGTRDEKLRWLDEQASDDDGLGRLGEPTELTPQSPFYFFVPRGMDHADEYRRGIPLDEAMPVTSTAPVTARDGFVLAFSEVELIERFEQFRDLSIADATIRERYFNNSRSPHYPPGDTRGWKLPAARKRAAEDAGWRDRIRRCLYRPFDWRPIFWADWMVDWPRPPITDPLFEPDNVALIARRQMPSGQAATYFWVCDCPAMDGVIRSDNRGSESLFPLLVGDGAGEVNFSDSFAAAVRPLVADPPRSSTGHLSRAQAFDVLCYVYALFHCPAYRRRYAHWLELEFPRIFVPRGRPLFEQLVDSGKRLIAVHLGRPAPAEEGTPQWRSETGVAPATTSATDASSRWQIAAGFPKLDDGRLAINKSTWLETVHEKDWEFHVGGYQVCRKWLRDRRNRSLTVDERQQYVNLVGAIRFTRATMIRIDEAIEQSGGLPNCMSVEYQSPTARSAR